MNRRPHLQPRLGYLTTDCTDLLPAEIFEMERQARIRDGMPADFFSRLTAEDMLKKAEQVALRDLKQIIQSLFDSPEGKGEME